MIDTVNTFDIIILYFDSLEHPPTPFRQVLVILSGYGKGSVMSFFYKKMSYFPCISMCLSGTQLNFCIW